MTAGVCNAQLGQPERILQRSFTQGRMTHFGTNFRVGSPKVKPSLSQHSLHLQRSYWRVVGAPSLEGSCRVRAQSGYSEETDEFRGFLCHTLNGE